MSGITTATSITAGDVHTCALLQDGTARCWGYKLYGGLGDNTTTTSNTPVDVLGLSDASSIMAGGYYSCAIASGSLLCWGANHNGQLGDGTKTVRPAPTPVRF